MSNSEKMDDLIYKIAKNDRDEDKDELYELMVDSELFSPNKSDTPDERVRFDVAKLKDHRMIMFYTEKESLADNPNVAGMPGFRALEMALESEGIDGILLQSLKNDSWFAISTPAIEIILKHRNNN